MTQKYLRKTTFYLLSSELAPHSTPPPPPCKLKMGKICLTSREKKDLEKEREIAIAVLATEMENMRRRGPTFDDFVTILTEGQYRTTRLKDYRVQEYRIPSPLQG